MQDQSSIEQQILEAIKNIQLPFLTETLDSLKAIKSCQIDASGKAVIDIVLGYPHASVRAALQASILQALLPLNLSQMPDILLSSKILNHQIPMGLSRIDGVKNIIAVASGKGGVGKSTTAVNLALALQAEGASVGMLDADIHGPSLPQLLGIDAGVMEGLAEVIEPIWAHNMPTMSIGLLVDRQTPMIWRGPMISQVFEKLLRQTRWGKLDYLVIDMPPGTGDIQITLAQRTPITGVVLVTTPQTVALDDARRCANLFRKVQVPVLGVVENMSHFCCPHCQTESHLFGESTTQSLSQEYNFDVLGQLPIDPGIGNQTEAGIPTVLAQPESASARIYSQIAIKTAAHLAKLAVDHSSKFPKIVVEKA